MRRLTKAIGAAALAAAAVVLSGCAGLNTLIWGQDGAAVISATETLIAAAAEDEASSMVCEGSTPELRSPSDWEGLAAEEPEKFDPDVREEFSSLDPQWSINLSLIGERARAGVEYPGDVFYRDNDGRLCLVAVRWSTIGG